MYIAFSVDTQDVLEQIYTRLKDEGNPIAKAPRMTGDDYYEACALDPDENRVEPRVVEHQGICLGRIQGKAAKS